MAAGGFNSPSKDLLLDENSEMNSGSPTAIVLCPEDYPENFRGHGDITKVFAHPLDYELVDAPIKPEVFVFKPGSRCRMFFRVSIKVGDRFFSATFLLDSGCCPHINASEVLYGLIKPRLVRSDVGESFMQTLVNGNVVKIVVKREVPTIHQPANIMGLPMFFLMGLTFKQQRIATLVFDENDVACDCAAHCLDVL
jgi:hypothetical protein